MADEEVGVGRVENGDDQIQDFNVGYLRGRMPLVNQGCNWGTLAYRLWGILVHQTILKEDLAVFTDDPSGS